VLNLFSKMQNGHAAGKIGAKNGPFGPVVVGLAVAWAGWNALVTIPAARSLYVNDSLPMIIVHRENFLHPGAIVIDLRGPGFDLSLDAVDRSFFLIAESLSAFQFQRITLARQGEARLIMDGARFQEVGMHVAEGDSDAVAVDVLTLHKAVIEQHIDPSLLSQCPDEPLSLAGMMAAHKQFHQIWWSLRPNGVLGQVSCELIPDSSERQRYEIDARASR
jgi:hypothetical protein